MTVAILIIIVICVALMGLFFGVTVAGGRAHDRQNAERERQRAERERRRAEGDGRPG